LRNPRRALELAKTAHDLAPEDAAVARTLGRLAFQAGDFKWSLSLLEESARKLVADPEVLCDLAWAQYSVGRVADAETNMQNALRPGTAFTRTDEARRFLSFSPLAWDLAKAQLATAQIQEALKADPNYAPALLAAAVVYEQQNNLNAARQACEKVLARYPYFAPANKRLAALYVALGDNQKAYNQASKAREALPDDPEVARTLGVVLYQRGDYVRAVQFLKESARKRATDAELFYYLGMAHYRIKEKGESKQALRQALTLNANANFVEEAKKVLAELK
jgi:Flp pilus assembly protein TadD